MRTTPEKFFDFFLHIEGNHKGWHPDHVTVRWIKGKPLEEGSIDYFEAYLHGKLHKGKLLMTKIEPNRKIEGQPHPFFWTIFMPKISLEIEPNGESCVFTATTYLRFGPLSSKLAKRNIEAVKRHMKEEGENLKRLSEEKGEESPWTSHGS